MPREALAFEDGGEWYPDSLGGYTVTMNSVLNAPPSTIANQWLFLETTTDSVPAGNGAYSCYGYMETKAAAGSSHPWFWYQNTGKNFQTVPTVQGYQYMARFGYDGETGVNAWWGLRSGTTRPTITFIDNPQNVNIADSSLIYAVKNQTFIIYVVNNSDFRSRYSGGTWYDPAIYQQNNIFGWALDENNVTSSLAIQRQTTVQNSQSTVWENVMFYSESPYEGSYTANTSGYYRFVWTYTIDNQVRTYTSEIYSVVINTPTDPDELEITSVTKSWTGNAQLFLAVTLTGDPTKVLLQVEDENQNWITYGELAYGNINSGQYAWWWQGYVQDGKHYRVFAYNDNDSTEYDLQNLKVESSNDVIQYASQLSQWVTALIVVLPDLFLWMPIEIRTVLMSAIIIMIILGLVGWLKS